MPSPFPSGLAVSFRAPSAARFRNRLHPLVSFAPLQSPPSRICQRYLYRQRLPWGSRSLIAVSPTGVRAAGLPVPAAFPSSTFLTSSTVFSAFRLVGLFHPTTTSRVRSTGAFPRDQPRRLVVDDLPSRRWRRTADDVATVATSRRSAHRACVPLANPLSSCWLLTFTSTRSPLELRLLQVLRLVAVPTPSHRHSLCTLSRAGQDPATMAYSDLRRRARLPLARLPTCSRFLACLPPFGFQRGLRFSSRRLNRTANRFRIQSLCTACATPIETRKKFSASLSVRLSLWTRLWVKL